MSFGVGMSQDEETTKDNWHKRVTSNLPGSFSKALTQNHPVLSSENGFNGQVLKTGGFWVLTGGQETLLAPGMAWHPHRC